MIRPEWWIAMSAAVGLLGCDDQGVIAPPADEWPAPYVEPTSPGNALDDLILAYERREIGPYAKLLAPEFIYKFQTTDYDEIPQGFWTHDEDSARTAALFQCSQVSDIRIELTPLSEGPSLEIDHPPGGVRIQLDTHLEIDQTDGITWVVSDRADMFFRPGNAEMGEDSTHWFLFEWRDLEAGASPEIISTHASEAVRRTTWGVLKIGACP